MACREVDRGEAGPNLAMAIRIAKRPAASSEAPASPW
jgi:hypothetical protein